MVQNEYLSEGTFYGKYVEFEEVKIAYRELLSAVIAFLYFAPKSPSSLIHINYDNSNVVSWLNKSRCSKKLGYRLLSVIELIKLKYNLQVSVVFTKSSSNSSTDSLSRGVIPKWLKAPGLRLIVNMTLVRSLVRKSGRK